MTSRRIGITVSRSWSDWPTMDAALLAAWVRTGRDPGAVLVSGHARSGDQHAERIWRRAGLPVEEHAAEWRPGGVYDPRAGFKRNARMVSAGADEWLAFLAPCIKPTCRGPWSHDSHGATHTAKLAAEAGILVERIRQSATAPHA